MSLWNMTKMTWALKARGEVAFREGTRERTSFRSYHKIEDDSSGKDLLLTGTLKPEISLRSQFPSPPTKIVIVCKKV